MESFSRKLANIPLDLVDLTPFNPPERTQKIEVLKESIAERGQLEPIHVVKNGTPRYTIADGNRRVTALRELNRDTVTAYVYEGSTEVLHQLYVELARPKRTLKNRDMTVAALQGGPTFNASVRSAVNYLQRIFSKPEWPMLVAYSIGPYLLSVAKRVVDFCWALDPSSPEYDRKVRVTLLWLARNKTQQAVIAYMRLGYNDRILRNAIERNDRYVPKLPGASSK